MNPITNTTRFSRLRRLVALLSAVVVLTLAGCSEEAMVEPEPDEPTMWNLTLVNNCGFVVRIFIDNADNGIIQPAQSRTFALNEGGHTVTYEGGGQSLTEIFTLNQNLSSPICD